MDIESLRGYCLSFADTSEKLQWGDALCFKVGGKMFAVAALEADSVPRFSLKCDPETFAELVEREGIAPAPYVGRYQWIGLQTLNTLGTREFKALIAGSYELVRAKLPKRRPASASGKRAKVTPTKVQRAHTKPAKAQEAKRKTGKPQKVARQKRSRVN